MRKNLKLFSLILLLTMLFLPFKVNASTSGGIVKLDLPSVPAIGQRPTYMSDNQNISVVEHYWVNMSDNKIMRDTDKFEANKAYEYVVIYSKKKSFDEVWFLDSAASEYCLGFGSSNWDESKSYAEIGFYFGNLDDYHMDYQEVNQNIGLPEVGGKPVYDEGSEYYTVESEQWVNVTDNVNMSSTDTFEAGKYYEYIVEFVCFKDVSNFFANFETSGNFVGEQWRGDSAVKMKLAAAFYFGDSQELLVPNGAIRIEKTNPPVVGGQITLPTVTVLDDGIQSVEGFWTVEEPEEFVPVEPGTVVEVGKRYDYNLHIELKPGYKFQTETDEYGYEEAIFELTDLNKNDNFVEAYTYAYNNDYGWGSASAHYESTFQILPTGKTIGFRNPMDIIYPHYGTSLDVYPTNENNAEENLTWESSNTNVATVDEYGNVNPVASGTTNITVTNKLGDKAVHKITVGIPATAVNVPYDELHVKVGETVQLGGTVVPSNATEKEVDWYVNWDDNQEEGYNSNSVWIDENNVLNAREEGKVIIRVTGPALPWTYIRQVTVFVEAAPELTGISFKQPKLTMAVDTTKKLEVTLSPNGAYSEYLDWESSNTRVARVDYNGVVTAYNTGTAVITVETDNGKKATCTITVEENPDLSFKDVSKNAWYYDSVKEAYNRGIIAGYGPDKFGPNDKVTRGQLVTFLYRIEGEPTVSGASKFSDVKEGEYYTDPVKWASNNHIVNGYGNTGKFGPTNPIIRQDLAVILNNYAKYKGYPYEENFDLSGFADYNAVKGGYAEPALKWAVKNHVMSGAGLPNGKRAIQPLNHTTRAQAAAMIVNFLDTFDM